MPGFHFINVHLVPNGTCTGSWTATYRWIMTIKGLHTVEVSYGDWVQVTMNNYNQFGHPFHLHGHDMWMLGEGNPQDGPYDPSKHMLNTINPARRDTFKLEANSWVVYMFNASNPGAWFFHCHIEEHLEAGLAVIWNSGVDRIPPIPAAAWECTRGYGPASEESSSDQYRIAAAVVIPILGFLLILSLIWGYRRGAPANNNTTKGPSSPTQQPHQTEMGAAQD